MLEKGYIKRREVDLGGYVQVQYQVTKSNMGYQNLTDTPIKNCNGGLSKIDSNDNKDNSKDNNITCIVDYLNHRAGTSYRASSEKTKSLINARMREGYTFDDFKRVIDHKCSEWMGTDMERYIRPETLFGMKFEGYLQTAPKRKVVEHVDMPDKLPCPRCGGESDHKVGTMYYCGKCNAGWTAR